MGAMLAVTGGTTMHLNLHSRTLPITAALADLAQRRLSHALGRFTHRIANVSLRFDDVNGPRGGRDIECLAVITLAPHGQLVVRGAYNTPAQAISDTLERVRENLQRNHERLVQALHGRR